MVLFYSEYEQRFLRTVKAKALDNRLKQTTILFFLLLFFLLLLLGFFRIRNGHRNRQKQTLSIMHAQTITIPITRSTKWRHKKTTKHTLLALIYITFLPRPNKIHRRNKRQRKKPDKHLIEQRQRQQMLQFSTDRIVITPSPFVFY